MRAVCANIDGLEDVSIPADIVTRGCEVLTPPPLDDDDDGVDDDDQTTVKMFCLYSPLVDIRSVEAEMRIVTLLSTGDVLIRSLQNWLCGAGRCYDAWVQARLASASDLLQPHARELLDSFKAKRNTQGWCDGERTEGALTEGTE